MSSKITKLEAINEILKTAESGNVDRANKMAKVVMDYISYEKRENMNSEFVELKSYDEESLFGVASGIVKK